MSKQEVLKNFINDAITVEPASLMKVEEPKETIKTMLDNPGTTKIVVDMIEIPEVMVASVHDSQGRLSDIVEAISKLVGYGAIPLDATDIPREVESLQRHTLFSIGSTIYAMDNEINQDKVDGYAKVITQHLEQGVEYTEVLNREFEYRGKKYETVNLTKQEWTILFSKFRLFKKDLYVDAEGKVILNIKPERL